VELQLKTHISNRIDDLMTLKLLGLVALLVALALPVFADEPPNFVIFVADDMAWEDCGAYGHPTIRTPNIDALAKDGMRLDRAYLTCSSCSPSRCSIMTGRYPHSTGAGELHLPLPGNQTMFTQPLKNAGYWTAAVGKWHLGEAVAGQVDYRKPSRPEAMGDAWVKAIKDRPRDKPFFLWAAHSDPHRGYKPGAVRPPHTADDVVVPPFFPDTPEVRKDLALYYDEISRFDSHIGMVLRELEGQGVADNTLVLVISDNGRPFPHCKTRVHVPGVRTPFIVRWPRKVRAGTNSKRVVSSVDIAPTILQLAGLPMLDGFQGVSIAPLLLGENVVTRQYAFSEHNWHDYRAFERGVHSEQYCYVRNWLPGTPGTPPADAVNSPTYGVMKELHAAGKLETAQQGCFETPRPTEFLYDVTADPNCIVNLVGDPSLQSTRDAMRESLEKWQSATADHFPGEDELTPDGFDRDTGKRIINAAHPSLQSR
jgi:N-sulfoglucosamine sulfohydrolase